MKVRAPLLVPAFAGTTVMTLFSYILSEITKEDFSEPKHLSTMIDRLAPGTPKSWARVAGWGAHYAVGVLFASVYRQLWLKGKIRPSVAAGAVLGIISGAIAVLIWKSTFKIHPLPPWINYNKFYLQLVPAHTVFAVTATIAYRLMAMRSTV